MKAAISAIAMTLFFAAAAHAELPSAPDAAINRVLLSGRPAVIDLGSRNCIPCKQMAPILESLSKEYRDKAGVLFVDVNQNEAASERFRVQMIPTQIFFDSRGKEVKRHIGFMDKAGLEAGLKAAGVK